MLVIHTHKSTLAVVKKFSFPNLLKPRKNDFVKFNKEQKLNLTV